MRANANDEMRSDDIKKRTAASGEGAPERSAWLLAGMTPQLCSRSTPPRRIARSVIRDGGSRGASFRSSKIDCTSRRTSNSCRWSGSIRQNIIGHARRPGTLRRTGHAIRCGAAARGKQSLTQGVFGNARRPFALLDQPAREHGASALFHLLVEQRANLLAEIGGMGQSRKFVALKRIARSREKELPRRLGWGTRHDSLLRRIGAM